MNTGTKTLLIYWRHAWVHKKYVLGILFALPLALLAHQIIPPIITASILDRLSEGDYIKDNLIQSFGADIALFTVTVIVAGTVMWRLVNYLLWKLEILVQRDVARRMFDHLMDLDMDFHANSFGGSLVSRTNKLISSYVSIADTIVYQVYDLFLMLVITGIIMWPRSPLFVLSLYAIAVVYLTIAVATTKNIRKLQSFSAKKDNEQTGFLADMVTNITAVKSFSAEHFERSRFSDATSRTEAADRAVMRGTLWRETFFSVANTSTQVLALTIATGSVVLLDAEIGTVFLMLFYTNLIAGRLWVFSQHGLRNLNRGIGDAEEATLTLMQTASVQDLVESQPITVSEGSVEFKDVNFSHDHTRLFHNFNLSIAPGEKVGLVGPSGGGKTTITKLLLRFMDVQNGSILLDNQNIAGHKQHDIREFISYVPQEPLLFHRSLSENIAYGQENAAQSDIVAAAKNAHAHEFISKLDKAYDTPVGERGVKLSGGQKQRVAIARSMIKKAPIIVLDEATSALDSESELLIQDALWKLMEGKTAIVIAHRLSTIQKMDRIIVLDSGIIVEQGTHKELVAKKNGHYARLWAHQSGGFLED